MILRGGRADEKVDAERCRDLVAEERTEACRTGDAPHDFPDEPAERHHVIPILRARLPLRRRLLEGGDHRLPVQPVARIEGGIDGDQARLVREQPADRDRLLAEPPEFRPVGRDRRVDVQLTAVREQVSADCRHAFGRRVDVDDRVAFPRPIALGVRVAAPEVDDRLAVDAHRHGCSPLAVLLEVVGEGLTHLLEPRVDRSLDLDRRSRQLMLISRVSMGSLRVESRFRCSAGDRSWRPSSVIPHWPRNAATGRGPALGGPAVRRSCSPAAGPWQWAHGLAGRRGRPRRSAGGACGSRPDPS